MHRLVRQPEVVWLSAIVATVILSVIASTEVGWMVLQLVVTTGATFGAFCDVQPRTDGRRPVARVMRALGSSVLGSFLVFTWLAVPDPTPETPRATDAFVIALLIWLLQLLFAAHLTALTLAGWRLTADGWRPAVPRSPEVLWLAFILLAMFLLGRGPELRGWFGVWLVGLAPMAVVFGCLAMLLRTPAEQRPRAAPLRTLASCLLGLLISTLIVAQSSTLGQVFEVAGGSFLWEFVLFWQWAITVLCGLAAWAIAREVMTLRTAVRAFAGGVAAIALAIAVWIGLSTEPRDPIASLSGEERVRVLSEAYGRARRQQPLAAWADGHETWRAFSIAFEPPAHFVVRVPTDYASALAARPLLASGVTISHTVSNPEALANFWNSNKTMFAILKPFGIKSESWKASWEPQQPDSPPTLVWTYRAEALQFTSEEFVDLGKEAELFHQGLLDVESAWGYWAELVQVWLSDQQMFERDLTRDLRRAQISLLQVAADCGTPAAAACASEVPGLIVLAETARSLERAGLPGKDEIRGRLSTPIYELSQKTAAFSAARRLYLYNLYQVVETSGVYNHPSR